ncbi:MULTISPECIES: serine/threonine-protein kinase [Streptomyces]|nr:MULTISPECIES: serine/threonine-protein kinase [Streptomyces]QKW01285.1 serine/threonine protein kinase [Streptomyces sp. NA02536]
MDALRAQDPARIGAYTVLARLGAGGMGQVYLGRSPGGRLVAIKVIRDEITDHPEALARFRREVETVRLVRSAYTANLIDASLDSSPHWLATEYVSGPTLSKAVGVRGQMPPETCRRLFAALAEGLAAVHGQGVTHRDLKPQNVLLAAQGPQLIDFGIARGVGQTALTEAGSAPGTPGFTAPEVLMRNEVGPAADVFALGATIAYAATGRPPFGVGEAAAVSYRAVHQPIDLSGVEPELAGLIQHCVAKDPAARPRLDEVIARCRVAAALVEDVFYAGLTTLAEAVPTVGDVGLPPQPAQSPTVGLHALPTSPSPYVSGYTPTQANPLVPPGRRRPAWLIAVAAGLVTGVVTAAFVLLSSQGKDDQGTDGKETSGTAQPGVTSKAPTHAGSEEPKIQPPMYVEQTNPSRDYWTGQADSQYGEGACQLPAEERNEHFQFGIAAAGSNEPYTSGQGRISFRLKYAAPEAGESYFVAVSVKPPHEIDPETGRPYEGGLQQNLDLGYTSEPIDLYEGHSSDEISQGVELTYPDDFQKFVRGKKYSDAIPIENDPGDWTVLFLHVQGPKQYASIACHGFVAK